MGDLERRLKEFSNRTHDQRSYLQGVVEFSDKMRRHYYPDCELCRDDAFDSAEESFISDSRLTMQSFIGAKKSVNDAFVEYISNIAQRALNNSFPLIGDFLRIRYLSSMYLNGEIDGLVYTTIIPYVRYKENRAVAGESVRLNVRQNNLLELEGGSIDLRHLLEKTIIKIDNDNLLPEERINYLIGKLPEKTDDWRASHAEPVYKAIEINKDYRDVSMISVESFDERAGEHERQYVHQQIRFMTDTQRSMFYELLQVNANRRIDGCYYDDVYRVLWYVAKKESGILII